MWADLAQTFAVVFVAELPDKTMVTSLTLAAGTRKPLAVFTGAAMAFVVHVSIAVLAGRLLGLLPDRAVKLAVAALFVVGSIVLWRESWRSKPLESVEVASSRVIAAAFGLILLAEWGDLTQLSIASLAAKSHSLVGVFAGGLAALWAVAGLAVTVGRSLLRVVRPAVIQRCAALVFATFAIVSTVNALS